MLPPVAIAMSLRISWRYFHLIAFLLCPLDPRSLQAYQCSLNGTLPLASLTNLTQLTLLDLSSNSHTGSIVAAVSRLQQLASLNLGSNMLSSTIPSTLGLLSGLSYVQFCRVAPLLPYRARTPVCRLSGCLCKPAWSLFVARGAATFNLDTTCLSAQFHQPSARCCYSRALLEGEGGRGQDDITV